MQKDDIQTWVTNYFNDFNANPSSVVTKYYSTRATFCREETNTKVSGRDMIIDVYSSVRYDALKVDVQTLKFDFLLAKPEKYEEGGFIVNAWGTVFIPGRGPTKFNQFFRLLMDEERHLWIKATILSVYA